MKKTLVIILSFLLALPLAACGGEGQAPAGGSVTDSPSGDASPSEEAAETELAPSLPSLDCGGAEFHVLTKMENDESGQWTARDIWVESENGEVVNDAVFERNRKIEEKYNCVITQSRMAMGGQYSYTMTKEISKLVMAGDSSYDLIMPTIQDAAALARDGMTYDLNALENIDLTKPWWNQQFEKDTRIGGHNYIGDGDICMTFMHTTYAIVFNKKLFADFGFESPYNVVTDGGWNIDYMLELVKQSAQDTDGNGKMDENDNIGLLRIYNQIEALYTASGQKMVTVDDDGVFRFEGDSEKSISILNQIFKLFNTKEAVFSTDINKARDIFMADRALLLFGTMNKVPGMRDMTSDFGILPLPKSLESQDQYYSYVQTWASGCAAIYITAPNIDRSTIITEDMAYHSMKIMTPADYDVALKTKFARDEESQSMLDLIYSVRTCDLGNLYNIGDVVSGVTDLVNNGKDTFASFMEKKLESINTTL
ncbi:MAG: hypothetical protein K6D94_08005, partial [Clostridiales bacterium]|nr:hypothetical protein [Clostridiales bacterium]